MRLTPVLRLISKDYLTSWQKAIRTSLNEAPNHLNAIKNRQLIYNKLNDLNNWYTRIIGLDEVKLSQQKVTLLQDELLQVQDKRRQIGVQLADIRSKSNELQEELHKVKRNENLQKFLDLMKQEAEILKMEEAITRTFQTYDQTERELFTAFTNAIRDSQDKQRAQLEYTKYFGWILSICGALLSFLYSSLRKQDLKEYFDKKLTTNLISVDLKYLEKTDLLLEKVIENQKVLKEQVNLALNQNSSSPILADDYKTIYESTGFKVATAICILYLVSRIAF